MNNSVSNASSPFLLSVSRAPTPSMRSRSEGGTSHANDSGRRYATKINVRSPSTAPNEVHSSSCPSVSLQRRKRTGWKVNHSPNALQNGDSFGRLRILYDITTLTGLLSEVSGHWVSEVRWISVRRRAPKSSGKYTCGKTGLGLYGVYSRIDTYEIATDDMRKSASMRRP